MSDEKQRAPDRSAVHPDRTPRHGIDYASQIKLAHRIARIAHWRWDTTSEAIQRAEEYADLLEVPSSYLEKLTVSDYVENFVHPDDKGKVLEAYRSAHHEKSCRFEVSYRIRTGKGQERWLREVGELAIADSGEEVGEIGVVQDITDLVKTEERLKQSQKVEALGRLTGGIAHDFNNLLSVILGNAELLKDRIGAKEETLLGGILRASERGAELTQRLLAFSRRQPLVPTIVDLESLVSGMSEMLDRVLGETIEVETVIASNLWATSADPGQVENAILNLALNARDAMPDGGRLTIECRNTWLEEADKTQPKGGQTYPYVTLAMSDTGFGMKDEILARAFEPFFTTKDIGQGSGLGLPMIYGFAKQSGGEMTIDSEEGRGTTVALHLPRANRLPERRKTVGEREIQLGGGEMVLVVEDDADVRALIVRMLKRLDYRVIDVADARDALARLADKPEVDIVLSDVVLPGGIDGTKLAEEARKSYPDLKIVLMSGYAAPSERDGTVDLDQVLLHKPFTRQQFAAALRKALD